MVDTNYSAHHNPRYHFDEVPTTRMPQTPVQRAQPSTSHVPASPALHSALGVVLKGHRKWSVDENIMICRDLDLRPKPCPLGKTYSPWALQSWPFYCKEIKASFSFPSLVPAGENSKSANSHSIRKGLPRPVILIGAVNLLCWALCLMLL